MSDEYGTLSLRGEERTREIEALCRRYRQHRETLMGLAADAPDERLGGEYQRVVAQIDATLAKVEDLRQDVPASPRTSSGLATAGPGLVTGLTGGRPRSTLAGDRPLVRAAEGQPAAIGSGTATSSLWRTVFIVFAGLAVLGALGWLIWRASSTNRSAEPPAQTMTETRIASLETEPSSTTTASEPISPTPPPVDNALVVVPASADYGTVRKGTRAVRQFEITNKTNAAIAIRLERSSCKCLFYDYLENLPAKGRETITVTIDGARPPLGPLHESVDVRSKRNPKVSTVFAVNATIK